MSANTGLLILSAPVFVSLELESRCPNCCPYCGSVFAAERARPPLSLDGWRRVLDKLQPSLHRLVLTGGEPTRHPEFEAILGLIDALNVPFAIFTNARWPHPNRLLSRLADSPCFEGFLVSLHGGTADVHEAFTHTPGSFTETVANIERTAKAGFRVTTSTVIMAFNHHRLADVANLAAGLGVERAIFNRYLGVERPGLTATPEQLRQAIQTVDQELALRLPIPVHIGNCVPQCFYRSSSEGWLLPGIAFCTVDPWGRVRPSNHASLICGDLLSQSLEEVWQSEVMWRWRRMIPAQCYECLLLEHCGGGSREVALFLDLPHDPLIGEPIREQEEPEPLAFYEGLRPMARFAIEPQSFGFALIRGNRVIPVAPSAKSVLDALDGTLTLREIRQQFREEALSLVGSLYRKGLIELEDSE